MELVTTTSRAILFCWRGWRRRWPHSYYHLLEKNPSGSWCSFLLTKVFRGTRCDPFTGWPYQKQGSFEKKGTIRNHSETGAATQDIQSILAPSSAGRKRVYDLSSPFYQVSVKEIQRSESHGNRKASSPPFQDQPFPWLNKSTCLTSTYNLRSQTMPFPWTWWPTANNSNSEDLSTEAFR